MKYFIALTLISSVVYARPSTSKRAAPVRADIENVKKEQSKKVFVPKTEDCDEKAKKTVEIKPESISLTGNTGCSLDDVK